MFARSGVAENRVVELANAVAVAEIDAETVLRVLRVAAVSAADSHAAVVLEFALKTRRLRRLQPLDAGRALPVFAVRVGVRVNAGGRVGETGLIGNNRDARNLRKRRSHRRITVERANILIHPVHHRLAGSCSIDNRARRPSSGGCSRWLLAENIREEKIRLRVRVRRHPIRPKCPRTQHRRGGYIDRCGVKSAVERRGLVAVGRIVNLRTRREARDRHALRCGEKSALHRERSVADKIEIPRRVIVSARRRETEVTGKSVDGLRSRFQPCVEKEIGIIHRRRHSLNREHVIPRCEQRNARGQIHDFEARAENVRTVAARRRRVPCRRRGRVGFRDFHAVDVGHESIVVARNQLQRIEHRACRDGERIAHKR